MAVVPERREMRVQPACERQGKVLQITVIGGGDDGRSAGFQEIKQCRGVVARGIDMLDHFKAHNDRKAAVFRREIVIGRALLQAQFGEGLPGLCNPLGRRIDAGDGPFPLRKLGRDTAVPAAQVEKPGRLFAERLFL